MKNILYCTVLLGYFSCSSNQIKKPFDVSLVEDNLFVDEGSLSKNEIQKNKFYIDKTSDYGLAGVKAYNFSVIDLDIDGFSDLVIIPSFYAQPRFFYFKPKMKKFVEGRSPFEKPLKASFFIFNDINNDGILDAISGVLNQKSELSKEPLRIFKGKKNSRGRIIFSLDQVIEKVSPISTAGLIDFNLDGKLDLFVGNWFKTYKNKPLAHRDSLLQNTDSGFKDVSDRLIGENSQNLGKTMFVNATPTYSVQVCDMDQNAYPDILTTSTNQYSNKLWMNKGRLRSKKRQFIDEGRNSLFGSDVEGSLNRRGGGRTFAVACADYNNDTIMDVFLGELSHNYDDEGVDTSSLLTGSSLKYPPKFIRTEYLLDKYDPDWHQADRRGIWFDYNNDGLLDLLVDNSGYPPHSKLILFKQLPDHSFENVAPHSGLNVMNPISSVIADFNKDGKMDILTSRTSIRDASISERIFLYENQYENLEKNKSIRFYLQGDKSNKSGINAMIIIKVKTPQGISYRRQYVSYSYGALPPQNEEGVHFGLADGEKLLNVKVKWPFSKKIKSTNIEVNYKIPFAKKEMNQVFTLCEKGQVYSGRGKCF